MSSGRPGETALSATVEEAEDKPKIDPETDLCTVAVSTGANGRTRSSAATPQRPAGTISAAQAVPFSALRTEPALTGRRPPYRSSAQNRWMRWQASTSLSFDVA